MNMETRLVKRNVSMPGLPLLSHFCVFFIIIIIISIIKKCAILPLWFEY